MNLDWDDHRTRKFVTNIGVITSDGLNGPNIMTVEWAHHISHAPSLMAICITKYDATYDNIIHSKEFGISLCASDQNVVSSISGEYSGFKVDKIEVLKEFGVEFYQAKKINVEMLKDAAMNAECKLYKVLELGDHTMFIGKVIELSASLKPPLIYHNGKYWKPGKQMPKPDSSILKKIDAVVAKHTKYTE